MIEFEEGGSAEGLVRTKEKVEKHAHRVRMSKDAQEVFEGEERDHDRFQVEPS